jgi:Double-GTPase 2
VVFVVGVVAILVYLALCYLAVVFVVVPAFAYLVVSGVVIGVLAAGLIFAGTLLRVGELAPSTVTPADVGHRLPKTGTPFPRDDAWPHYLFGQASTDLRTAARHLGALVGWMWLAIGGFFVEVPFSLVFWPLLLLPLTVAAVATAAVVATGLGLAVVLGAVLALARLGWLVIVGALRGADLGVRALRRAKATCHHPLCSHRSRLPAYRCTCGTVHHDIRAGRQGVFVRRCVCNVRLPTTVVAASAGLVPVCQDCGRDLRAQAGALTDVLVPVFGSTSAGKTRLVYAGIVALSRHLSAVGATFRLEGAESEVTFREASTIVEQGTQTTKTDAGRPPVGITVRLDAHRRPALLHLFDAAGESFTSRDQAADLRFLDDPQGLVFVLDPFSVPDVAGALTGALAPRLTAAAPAHLDPEQSYLVTAQWLRDQGVGLNRTPLAIAVVKADLLLGLPPAEGLTSTSTSADIQQWLRGKGLDNLLDGAARDFGEVSYHLVASLDAGAGSDGSAGPTSPAHPLLWLLRRSGVMIPDRVPAAAS